jgi:hypothetical protein
MRSIDPYYWAACRLSSVMNLFSKQVSNLLYESRLPQRIQDVLHKAIDWMHHRSDLLSG